MEQQIESETQLAHENAGILLLTSDSVEALRSKQKEVYYQHYDVVNGIDNETILDEEMRALVDAHLVEAGINKEDPNFILLRHYLDDWSYDKISDSEWNNGAWENSDVGSEERTLKPSSTGRDRIERASRSMFKELLNDSDNANTSSIDKHDHAAVSNDSDLSYEEAFAMNQEFYRLNERLSEARDKWAKASSIRLGRAFSLKDKKREQLKNEYQELVRERGRWALDNNSLKNDNLSSDEKNTFVISYLFDEQKQLREKTIKELEKTKVSKFVGWMSRGNRAQRIAKGIGVGMVAGLGGSLLAGAAGAGIIAAGAVGASRFVKGYASRDKHRGSNVRKNLEDSDAQKITSDMDSVIDVDGAHAKVNELLERDVKTEQKERIKSLGWGASSIALGAGIGFAFHEMIDQVRGLGGSGDHATDKPFDRDGDGIPDQNDKIVDIDGDGHDDRRLVPNIARYEGGTHTGTQGSVDHGSASGGGLEFSDAAYVVQNGEGWYQTFQDMNVPVAERAALLEKVGPKLQEQGWAYRMPNGEWGISQPGRLPDDVLQLIQDNRR